MDGPVDTSIDATTVPKVAVTASPGAIRFPAMPQAKSFQPALPQPRLISPTVVSSPKDAVRAIPVTVKVGSAKSFHWF